MHRVSWAPLVTRALVCTLAATAAAGCARTVGGDPTPAASALAILPTEDQVGSTVGNPLSAFGFPPFSGGVEILPDGFRTDADASPIRCAAVTDTAPRIVYEPLPVLEAARRSYFSLDQQVAVSGADVAVIRLANADAARRTFAGFAGVWRGCAGTTVVKQLRGLAPDAAPVSAAISDTSVDVAGKPPTISATVLTRGRPGGPPVRYERALGVRADAVVEVSLAVKPAGERIPEPRLLAVRTAAMVLDRVGRTG